MVRYKILRCYLHSSAPTQKQEPTPAEVADLTSNLEEKLEVKSQEPKVTKAQKRRDKKLNKDREREQAIAEQEVANLQGARHLETEKIRQLLTKRSLAFYDIPSDGHW